MKKESLDDDSSKENAQEIDQLDLPGVLIRTVTDLQVMKEKYESGLTVYNRTVDAMGMTEDIEEAKQMMKTGLEVHVSLLSFIKSACQLVGVGSEWIEVKEEPDLDTFLKLETEDDLLDDMIQVNTTLMDFKSQAMYELDDKRLVSDRKFSCDQCEKCYMKKGHLNEHKKLKHGFQGKSKDFECDDCTKRFSSQGRLSWHKRMVHSDERLSQVDKKAHNRKSQEVESSRVPGKVEEEGDEDGLGKNDIPDVTMKVENSLDEFELMSDEVADSYDQTSDDGPGADPDYQETERHAKHSNGKKSKTFKCDMCEKSYKNRGHLKEHKICAHTNERPFSCDMCKANFQTKSTLKSHQRRIHHCEHCSLNFDSLADKKGHLRSSHPLENEKRKKERALKKEQQRIMSTKKPDGGPFNCDMCDKSFQDKSYFEKHQKLFHYCKHCGLHFVSLVTKRRHIRDEHPGLSLKDPVKNQIICDCCGFITDQPAHLKRHMLQHTGERPFTCEVCKKGFTTDFGLRHHMYLHTGERPFECDVCTRRFRKKAQLHSHYRLHTGEKPFKCDLCGKAFHLGGERNKHVKKCPGPRKLEL